MLLSMGLEIKTASEGEYDKLNQPKEAHAEQTCIYMACLDLPLMWTLYYNKSNSNFTTPFSPWLTRFDNELWNRLQMRFIKSQHRANTGDIPEREEGMHCRWCPFSWTCMPQILQFKQQRSTAQFTQRVRKP